MMNAMMPQSRAEKGYHAERRGGKAGVILVLILLVFISPLIKGTVGGIIGFIVALILLPFILVLGIRGSCPRTFCNCSDCNRRRYWSML